VTDLDWQGEGPVFTIDSDDRRWTLRLDEARPCLSGSDGRTDARLLGLDHVAAIGRRDESAFNASTLTSFERHRGRILATYAPPDWHGLIVRAAWGPTPGHDGFDLEVQVAASSVGALRRVEVAVVSTWSLAGFAEPIAHYHYLEPRDVHAAALTYDGREPIDVLRCLMTMPVPASSPPTSTPDSFALPGPCPSPARAYLEMAHPNDCARRIVSDIVPPGAPPLSAQSIRYGLFGHDLEKGVVLRGRIRGLWIDADSGFEQNEGRYQSFLREPPSLGP
jgi:hypothetical protein